MNRLASGVQSVIKTVKGVVDTNIIAAFFKRRYFHLIGRN